MGPQLMWNFWEIEINIVPPKLDVLTRLIWICFLLGFFVLFSLLPLSVPSFDMTDSSERISMFTVLGQILIGLCVCLFQNNAACITPALQTPHRLPIPAKACLNDSAPNYIMALLHPYAPTRHLRSLSNDLLVIPLDNYTLHCFLNSSIWIFSLYSTLSCFWQELCYIIIVLNKICFSSLKKKKKKKKMKVTYTWKREVTYLLQPNSCQERGQE